MDKREKLTYSWVDEEIRFIFTFDNMLDKENTFENERDNIKEKKFTFTSDDIFLVASVDSSGTQRLLMQKCNLDTGEVEIEYRLRCIHTEARGKITSNTMEVNQEKKFEVRRRGVK